MQLTVVLLVCFAVSLTTLNGLPWSPTDPIQPGLFQLYKNQKQRNLAKIQLLPQNAISFVGPRQAPSSLEEEEDDGYYDDDYDVGNGPAADYTDSEEEDDYEWR